MKLVKTVAVMSTLLRDLTVSAAAVLLIVGLVAWSANFARAQDTPALSGAAAGPSVQPDKKPPPANFAGCWNGGDGSIMDTNFGAGGTVFNSMPARSQGYAVVAVQPDGNIVVAGITSSGLAVSRFLGQ